MDAKQFLKERMQVWCINRKEWEKNHLSLLSGGDFVDNQGRLHRRENHKAYVTLEDALSAIRMVEEKILADKETELQRLKSENHTMIKMEEIRSIAHDLLLGGHVDEPIELSYDSIDGPSRGVEILCAYKSGETSLEEAIEQLKDPHSDSLCQQ